MSKNITAIISEHKYYKIYLLVPLPGMPGRGESEEWWLAGGGGLKVFADLNLQVYLQKLKYDAST